MSNSPPSSSPSRSSDDQHAAAIDKITQDAEGASYQHQTTKDEIAVAVEGAELVDGVLGPAPQASPPREHHQIAKKHINAAWEFINMIFGYVLTICDFIRGAVVAAVIGFYAECARLLEVVCEDPIYIWAVLVGFFFASLFKYLGWT